MDQARSTISKINMEGEGNSHVEMKLSADADEEVGGNGVGEHHHHNGVNGPYAVRKTGRSPRNICFLVGATLLIFVIGYLIGYLVHRKKEEAAPSCPAQQPPNSPPNSPVEIETGAAPLMDWADVKSLLAEQLSLPNLEKAFSDFASDNHQSGTSGDDKLANMVVKKFKDYHMDSWTDEHFVKVQVLPTTNRVTFKGVSETPSGFLSYSHSGNVSGSILYAHYGQVEDYNHLKNDLDLTGRVVLVKAGKISFAEKLNATAVLLYADDEAGKDAQLYGHVHLGSGDPYTPGFPSFNHTAFAPVRSSGLPAIPAQTITIKLGGDPSPREWLGVTHLGSKDTDTVTVEVNNVLVEKRITNVLGVIKGFVDPDRYIIVGAQRDSWGPGFAKSTVGTKGFLPRRSIVFASWSGGEYGSVGATEWLEGYLSSLSMKAFSYISLDALVTGVWCVCVCVCVCMMQILFYRVQSLCQPLAAGPDRENHDGGGEPVQPVQQPRSAVYAEQLEEHSIEDSAFPFLTFSGIPSISFQLSDTVTDYPFGTVLDTRQKLNGKARNALSKLVRSVAQVAGHMILRLVHDHLLRFDLSRYNTDIRSYVARIDRAQSSLFPKALTSQWLVAASNSFSQASRNIGTEIQNSQLSDLVLCREINDRMMQVERNLLSPYVSPVDSPSRHIIVGSGRHTFQALLDHLEAFRLNKPEADAEAFQKQLALATWTLQSCANSLAGDIWSLNNDI
ncbi:hypothetical protein NHX12_004022 [Muraenolepis orangiensis]|uniref:Transferrin receptor protein 1 n=1 Tax=Muraenolepis orangiensis TaxID=630683 RepID=A0A9Q0IDT4_9TELE|nr:hypothetical protein NHX12_004022 [Muraenolepis orangiensis]